MKLTASWPLLSACLLAASFASCIDDPHIPPSTCEDVSASPPDDDDTWNEDMVPSVRLVLVNGSGTTIEASTGGWAYWSGAEDNVLPVYSTSGGCVPSSPPGIEPALAWNRADGFTCGSDNIGSIEITAGAIGYMPTTRTVEVRSDGCDAITEEIEIVLDESTAACTAEVVPSLLVTVVDEKTGFPDEPTVEYYSRYLGTTAPCEPRGDMLFACGQEVAGPISADAEATSVIGWLDEVFVPTDECHVITQTASINMLWND